MGEKWLGWCEGHGVEHAKETVAALRKRNIVARREGDKVFVLDDEEDNEDDDE